MKILLSNGKLSKTVVNKLNDTVSLLNWYYANQDRLPLLYSGFGSSWATEIKVTGISTQVHNDMDIFLELQLEGFQSIFDIDKLATEENELFELECLLANLKYINREINRLIADYGMFGEEETLLPEIEEGMEKVAEKLNQIGFDNVSLKKVNDLIKFSSIVTLDHFDFSENGKSFLSVLLSYNYNTRNFELSIFVYKKEFNNDDYLIDLFSSLTACNTKILFKY